MVPFGRRVSTDKSIPQKKQRESAHYVTEALERLGPVGSRMIEPLIQARRTEGRPTIPVHGYPLAQPPDHVRAAAVEAAGSIGSSSSSGIIELRTGIANVLESTHGGSVSPDEVLITCGAMHGLQLAFNVLLAPGDEAVVLTPCYFFNGLIELAGAQVVPVQTPWMTNGLKIDFEHVRAAVTSRTKVLVISSPVNPTGCLYSKSDVETLIQIAEEFDLILISDESYDRMIFDNGVHYSPFDWGDARLRTVLIKSFTKSYALSGWRVGYIAADAGLISYFRKLLEWSMLYCPYSNQRVALAALEGPQDWLLKIFSEIEQRRNQLIHGLAGVQGYQWAKPQGGPFLFLQVCGEEDDETTFAQMLLDDFGIPAVPGTYFHAPGFIRIPYSGAVEAVDSLIEALVAASPLLASKNQPK